MKYIIVVYMSVVIASRRGGLVEMPDDTCCVGAFKKPHKDIQRVACGIVTHVPHLLCRGNGADGGECDAVYGSEVVETANYILVLVGICPNNIRIALACLYKDCIVDIILDSFSPKI